MKQSTNLELNEQSLGGNEWEELTHSQQQPQAPKLTKRSQQSDKQSEQDSQECGCFLGLKENKVSTLLKVSQ